PVEHDRTRHNTGGDGERYEGQKAQIVLADPVKPGGPKRGDDEDIRAKPRAGDHQGPFDGIHLFSATVIAAPTPSALTNTPQPGSNISTGGVKTNPHSSAMIS